MSHKDGNISVDQMDQSVVICVPVRDNHCLESAFCQLLFQATNDLGADSLDTVELIMDLEKDFDITIPDEDAEKIVTVGDAVRYIENAQK